MRAEFGGGQIFCCVGALAIGVCDWCVCVWMYGCVRVRVCVCECVRSLTVAKDLQCWFPGYWCVCFVCVCIGVWVSACVCM